MNIRMKIPDTLTLEERAEAALNAMIGVADEDYDCIPFFFGNTKSNPATMTHSNWDYGSTHGRLIDAIVLVRIMTGSTFGEDVEKQYRKNLLSFFGNDGLSYRQKFADDAWLNQFQSVWEPAASMIDQRAVCFALGSWYLATQNNDIRQTADRHIAALKRIACKERLSWYYPGCEYKQNGWPSHDAILTHLAYDPCAMWGRQIAPLLRYHKITGNLDAFELAENFTNNIVYRSGAFLPDGAFNSALEYRNGHFHTRMGTLDAVARFAEYTHDSNLIQWVKMSYDWALQTYVTSFGWTPGDLEDQAYEHETCSLVDAISIGIVLARCGYPEYWGVAERFIRNHLTESQLMEVDWISELKTKEQDIPRQKTHYHVGRRLRGSFSGYSAPNDFVYAGPFGRGHFADVQVCCLGAGGRGLYTSWNNAINEDRSRVSINLLFNRSTEWLDLFSYLPHIGRLDIKARSNMKELAVRIPEWVPFGGTEVLRVSAEGEQSLTTGRNLPWVNHKKYILLKDIRQNESITITFPMLEKTTVEHAMHLPYTVRWRGDDVIGIDPPGSYYPLYNRRKITKDVQMKDITMCRSSSRNILYE